MSKSTEEWLETADHSLDKLRRTVNRFKNGLTSDNLRLTERYVNLELEILVTLSIVGGCGNVHDLIVGHERYLGFGKPEADTGHAPRIESVSNSDDQPMLVNVVQFAEMSPVLYGCTSSMSFCAAGSMPCIRPRLRAAA